MEDERWQAVCEALKSLPFEERSPIGGAVKGLLEQRVIQTEEQGPLLSAFDALLAYFNQR